MPHKYSDLQRIEWLSNLNPNFKNQIWHDDIVYLPDDLIYKKYFRREGTVKKKINPSKICGIEYAYAYNCPIYKPEGWTYHWLEFFTNLMRLDWVIDNFPTKEKVINHIHHNAETKTVMQFGDHYFTTGGQHRLCLAKYLELDEVEVDVESYVFDRRRFQRERRFEKLVPALFEVGLLGSWFENNPDIDFTALDFGRDTVYIKKDKVEYLLRRMQELKRFPYRGIANSLKAMNIESYNRNHIDSDEHLFLLDPYLLKHNKSILSKILV
ncbi:hypothetical protein DRF65_13680 [Chryseobacterium pennae]|uniref:ParB/Sulfiredoxin domain-containing protein n=1 Tax=Chryseobacterium pennae TaxID=2258962 RepID=A0A3D9C7Q5_9FLAO|nr:hypothetical protein [Chryseobacterium pennae]REC61784.1 hypothetical protein DRF65_13680 [Chryseobacterium pennae]